VDLIQLAQNLDQLAESSEHGNKLSGSIKGGKLLDQLSEC
jgi:hypothetical protein